MESFQERLQTCFKRTRNLVDILVKSELKDRSSPWISNTLPDSSPPTGHHPVAIVPTVKIHVIWQNLRDPQNGNSYVWKKCTTCNTKGVIYAIRCLRNKLYITKTFRSLKTCIRLRNKRLGSPLVSHFMEFNYSERDLTVWVVYVIFGKYWEKK